MANVLGMSVSSTVALCHTSVTVSVTGSNLKYSNLHIPFDARADTGAGHPAELGRVDCRPSAVVLAVEPIDEAESDAAGAFRRGRDLGACELPLALTRQPGFPFCRGAW